MKRFWATIISLTSVVFIVGLWYLVALKLDASVIVPTPLEVLDSLKELFTTKDFVLALILGIISGTYSSIFFASTLLVMYRESKEKQKALARAM